LASLIFEFKAFVWSNTKKVVRVLAAMMALLCVGLPLFSQASQSAIQGAVSDQSGGVIAGANVTVTDVARGATRALATDSAGQYAANSVIPGTYTVRAEAKGFRTLEHSGVLVEVGQTIRVDLVLQPGEQTQTITVTGEVPVIDTTDAQMGGTISNNLVNALPLNGRNFQRLLQLHPGVVTTIGSGTGNGDYTNGRRQGDDLFRVEGIATIAQTAGQSGVLNGSYRSGDSSSLLPLDAIQEFDTGQNPKAQDGWKEGSVVSIGIKSGTNSFHGTAFAFGRNAGATDAANYFTGSVTPATLEQFGATAGGRIIKDKLFWFAGFEGLRDTVGDVAVLTIPSDISIGDPTKSMVDACNLQKAAAAGVSQLSAQLAGLSHYQKGDPASCAVAPASSTFENLFPYNPNVSNLYNPPLSTLGPLNNGVIKADYILGPHHHISGMFFEAKANQLVNQTSGELLPQWELNLSDNVYMFGGSWIWTPNSTWVNDVRLGTAYFDNSTLLADRNLLPSNPYPSGYGMPTGVTNPLYGGLPEMTFSGLTGVLGSGTRGPSERGPEGSTNLVDNVSYLRGKHAFKFGFEYVDIIYDGVASDQGEGMIKFRSLQNFLAGSTNGGTILVGNAATNFRSHWFAGFFQDDWRITTRVTLNLGLRYEYEGSPVERNNYFGNFNPNVPATSLAVQQVGPGAPIPSLFNSKHNGFPTPFSPRLGVAWDVRGNGRTVVRASASLMADYSILQSTAGNFAPFGANVPSIGVNNSGTTINQHTPDMLSLAAGQLTWNLVGPIFPISDSQTINAVTYTGLTCSVPTATVNGVPNSGTPCTTAATDPNFRRARAAEWSLDIERAITNSLAIDVAYVGNYGFDEQFTADLNQPALGVGWAGAATTNCINPLAVPLYGNCKANTAAEVGQYSAQFPYLNYINEVESGAASNYNALQVTANKRVSHGLSFLAGYTYAHALDDTPPNRPINASALRSLYYGNGGQDLRNRFTFSTNYLIPGMKSPGQMLEGWSVSPLVVLQSSLPWFPNDATTDDLLGTGEFNNAGNTGSWNYSGPASAFTTGPTAIPCYGPLAGCTPFGSAPAAIQAQCTNAATAPYAAGSTNAQLALASLANYGCYVRGGGVLTPPAYGTVGNAGKGTFRGPNYYNMDFSVAKIWKFKERYSAQFRMEFFNLLNRADFAQVPGATDPTKGFTGQFGCSCTTPDSSSLNPNPVLGSGGPRHIQFGLKLMF